MTEITYGRLDKVLRSLGFTVHVLEDRARVYKHADTGAFVFLPILPLEKVVRPYHLVTVRTTLDLYGIADPMDFDTRLQKAG